MARYTLNMVINEMRRIVVFGVARATTKTTTFVLTSRIIVITMSVCMCGYANCEQFRWEKRNEENISYSRLLVPLFSGNHF